MEWWSVGVMGYWNAYYESIRAADLVDSVRLLNCEGIRPGAGGVLLFEGFDKAKKSILKFKRKLIEIFKIFVRELVCSRAGTEAGDPLLHYSITPFPAPPFLPESR
jgi:hypothetical protein